MSTASRSRSRCYRTTPSLAPVLEGFAAWADKHVETPTRLSINTYNRYRAQAENAPSKHVVCRLHGSWSAAMLAVGRDTAQARASADLKAIIAEGRRMAMERGCFPTVQQWQRDRAPGMPGRAAMYERFPDGWSEFASACGYTLAPSRAWRRH
jgi:hypothetical protein